MKASHTSFHRNRSGNFGSVTLGQAGGRKTGHGETNRWFLISSNMHLKKRQLISCFNLKRQLALNARPRLGHGLRTITNCIPLWTRRFFQQLKLFPIPTEVPQEFAEAAVISTELYI